MKKINIDGLLALNLEEIEIVYRRCRGDTVGNVAGEMGLGASTIWGERMPVIFKLLEVEKWEDIKDELCIPLRRIIHTIEELKEGWPDAFREEIEALREPVELTPEPESAEPERVFQEQPNSEADALHTEFGTIDTPPRESERRNPPWPLIAVPLLILCVVCIAAGFAGWRIIRPMIPIGVAQTEATQPPTPREEPSITQAPTSADVTLEPTAYPTDVAPAVVETELPIEATMSVPPTTEAVPTTTTPTPTEAVQPTPTPLFESALEDGLPDGMEVIYGKVNFVNGELIAQEPTLISIGIEGWINYQVEYETKKHTYCLGLKNNAVAAHAQDPDNMVAFSWNYCESAWYEVTNGNWELIESSHQGNVANPGTRITIRLVAEDGKFTVYINNQQRSSVIMEGYSQGKVYILLSGQSVVDNIRIISLP